MRQHAIDTVARRALFAGRKVCVGKVCALGVRATGARRTRIGWRR
jgi:hypothetical protein